MAKLIAIVLAVACLCAMPLFAQDQMAADQPSKYVWYEIAKVNSGKFQTYSKLVAEFRDAAATAAPDITWIAGTPITGDAGHVTFVTFHDNMASLEKMMVGFEKVEQTAMTRNANLSTLAAESEGGARSVLAQYKRELSYRPEMVPLANTMWWASTVVNLKPGCEYEFNDAVKQVIDLHKKVNDTDHWTAYEVRAGYPQPSILFVTRMQSLAEEDVEPPAAAKELFDSPLVRQLFTRVGKECIRHIESTYARVQPSLSRPPQALVAANPDFWTIKPEIPTTATKPAKTKKGALQPAVMKEPAK